MNVDIEKIIEEITSQIRQANLQDIPGSSGRRKPETSALAGVLEHSMLSQGVSEEEIGKACELAKKYAIAALVVPVWHTSSTSKLLNGSGVRLVTAISFPNGGQSLSCKMSEVRDALASNVDEIDLVPNFARLLNGRYQDEKSELCEIIALAKGKMKTKINIEWGMFSDGQKLEILRMAVDCGADFVKIQHFLSGGKAQPDEVKFVRSAVGNAIGIKIDGGIKTAALCRELTAAGADRMGLTATFNILDEEKAISGGNS